MSEKFSSGAINSKQTNKINIVIMFAVLTISKLDEPDYMYINIYYIVISWIKKSFICFLPLPPPSNAIIWSKEQQLR